MSLAAKALIQYEEMQKKRLILKKQMLELFYEDFLINEALKLPFLRIEGESDQDFIKRVTNKNKIKICEEKEIWNEIQNI